MRKKYTLEIIAEAVKNSTSIAGVVRFLGLKESGSNQNFIKKIIEEYKVDRSHFLSQYHHLKGGINKKHWSDVLVLKTNGKKNNIEQLRRCMIDFGIEYKCKECDNNGCWNGKKLGLEVHHVNGNWLDNRSHNVEFLCPNCHSQTPNYGSKNIPTKPKLKKFRVRKSRAKDPQNPRIRNKNPQPKFCNCGLKINRKSERCEKCYQASQRKIHWPSPTAVLEMVKKESWRAVGKKLGVSDNAVRKFIRNHGNGGDIDANLK